MADITDSAHTNHLIKLLMMLPSPHMEDTYGPFWDRVAADVKTSPRYVTGKIAMHLKLLLGEENPLRHRRELASYALYFFGQAGDELLMSIATEVDMGAPQDTAGRLWVQELRTTAFAVLEETFPEERVHEALTSWVRSKR
ncbi:hypothetical protein ACFWTE_28375 [Nocardiopsis sp. NPDC058631]|uniref:hypothetical protein n=1 Tax=Nocardiopsis sp. NPDC058631 TaxID=3346566 RepID=UPI00366188B5